MDLSVSIWAVIIGISALHGFFLSFVVLKRHQGYKTSNLWLGLIMLVFSFTLLEYTLLLSGHIESVVHIFSTNAPLIFLLGPFLWLFTKHSIAGRTALTQRDYLSFLPALLSGASFVPFYLLDSATKVEILSNLYGKGVTFPPGILILNLIFFSYLGVYVLACFRKIKNKTFVGPGFQKIQKRVFSVIIVIIIFFLLSFISFMFFLFSTNWRLEIHYALILLLSFLIYGFSYRIIFSKDELQSGKVKYQGKQIDPDSILKPTLEEILNKEKPYLDPELKLNSLADQMKISGHQLSQLINQSFETNFAGLVNQLRVDEAERLLKLNPTEKLLAIALDSGFSNQANFIRVFKQYKKQTPSEYRDSLKK